MLRMWPFKKKGDGEIAESKIPQMAMAMQNSFQRVKNDMDNVNAWLNHLYSQDSHRQTMIEDMRNQITHLSSRIESSNNNSESHSHPEMEGVLTRVQSAEAKVHHLSVSIHSIQPVMSKIAELNSKINLVEESQKTIFDRLKDISSRVGQSEVTRTRTHMNLREKIVRKIAKHSKEYIKNIILSTISKYDQIAALQLREMIVEEQGLCSKSTFYRLLEEIEADDNVNMVSKGKEKMYIPKIVKQH